MQKYAPLKLKLTEVANAALGLAPVLHLGDTDHRKNRDLMRWLGRPATLRAFAAAGVTSIFLERLRRDQGLCDALADDRITTAFFVKSALPNMYRPDKEASQRETATLLKAAHRAGIKVHCADSSPEWQEQSRLSALLKHITGGKIGVVSLLTDLPKFKNFLNEKMRDAEARNDQVAMEEVLVSQLAVIAQLENFNKARCNDSSLASFIADTLPRNGRAVVVYGAHHGAGPFGLGRELRCRGLNSRKIDIFAEAGLRPEKRKAPRQGDYLLKEGLFLPVP